MIKYVISNDKYFITNDTPSKWFRHGMQGPHVKRENITLEERKFSCVHTIIRR